jgi:hypothetical protein
MFLLFILIISPYWHQVAAPEESALSDAMTREEKKALQAENEKFKSLPPRSDNQA